MPFSAAKVTPDDLLSLKELCVLFKAGKDGRLQRDGKCWLCLVKPSTITYNHREYCTRCMASTIRFVIMPLIAASEVPSWEKEIVLMVNRHKEATERAASTHVHRWKCSSCTSRNEESERQCVVCGEPRTPPDPGTPLKARELQSLGLSPATMKRERELKVGMEKERKRLEARLADMHLTSLPVQDDGNCFFRAVSLALLMDQKFHECLRFICADYIREHEEEFQLYTGVGEEYNKYLCDISLLNTWGDEIAAVALSKALDASIHILTSDERRWHRLFRAHGPRQLTICYFRPVHYSGVGLESRAKPKLHRVDVPAQLQKFVETRMKATTPSPSRPLSLEASPESSQNPSKKKIKDLKSGAKLNMIVTGKAADGAAMESGARQTLTGLAPAARIHVPHSCMSFSELSKRRLSPIVVRILFDDVGRCCFRVSDDGHAVGDAEGEFFYLHSVDLRRLWSRRELWSEFLESGATAEHPLFVLQRCADGSILTSAQALGALPAGPLKDGIKVTPLVTTNEQIDLSPALFTAAPLRGDTTVKLRLATPSLEATEVVMHDKCFFVANQNFQRHGFAFETPFESDAIRLCSKCHQWFDRRRSNTQCFHRDHATGFAIRFHQPSISSTNTELALQKEGLS